MEIEYDIFATFYGVCQYFGCGFETETDTDDIMIDLIMIDHWKQCHGYLEPESEVEPNRQALPDRCCWIPCP